MWTCSRQRQPSSRLFRSQHEQRTWCLRIFLRNIAHGCVKCTAHWNCFCLATPNNSARTPLSRGRLRLRFPAIRAVGIHTFGVCATKKLRRSSRPPKRKVRSRRPAPTEAPRRTVQPVGAARHSLVLLGFGRERATQRSEVGSRLWKRSSCASGSDRNRTVSCRLPPSIGCFRPGVLVALAVVPSPGVVCASTGMARGARAPASRQSRNQRQHGQVLEASTRDRTKHPAMAAMGLYRLFLSLSFFGRRAETRWPCCRVAGLLEI